MKKHFRLGEFICTPAAMEVLEASGQMPGDFLARHVVCDWGQVTDEQRAANANAIKSGGPVVSIYRTLLSEEVLVVTEANRSKTVLMLPAEREESPAAE